MLLGLRPKRKALDLWRFAWLGELCAQPNQTFESFLITSLSKGIDMKIAKLNINPTSTGINLDVDGAPEGIHIEYEILPDITKALMECALGNRAATQDD